MLLDGSVGHVPIYHGLDIPVKLRCQGDGCVMLAVAHGRLREAIFHSLVVSRDYTTKREAEVQVAAAESIWTLSVAMHHLTLPIDHHSLQPCVYSGSALWRSPPEVLTDTLILHHSLCSRHQSKKSKPRQCPTCA